MKRLNAMALAAVFMLLVGGMYVQHSSYRIEASTDDVVPVKNTISARYDAGWDINDAWNSSENFTINDIAIGDIDKDGDYDIVVVGGNTTQLYKNGGNGNFVKDYTDEYVGHEVISVEIADMNSDGTMDIVELCGPAEPTTSETLEIRVLGQRVVSGNTTYVEATLEEIDDVYGYGYPSFAIGDIDKKNGPDMVISYSSSTGSFVASPSVRHLVAYYNSGMFGAFVDVDVGTWAASDDMNGKIYGYTGLVDVDGDSYLDIVNTNFGKDSLTSSLETQTYVFLTPGGEVADYPAWNGTIPNQRYVYGMALGDFSGDGVADIMLSTSDWLDPDLQGANDGAIYMFRGKGAGNFTNASRVYSNHNMGPIRGISAGSFDPVVGLDLVFFQAWQDENDDYIFRIEIAANDGTGHFGQYWYKDSLPFSDIRSVGTMDRVFVVKAGNMDNTGLSDIVYGGWNTHVLLSQWTDMNAPSQVPRVWAYDKDNDNGGTIVVEWDAVADVSLDHYNIYCSASFLTVVQGMTPETSVSASQQRKVEITTHDGGQPIKDGTDYYVAVTPVDQSNNENYVVACFGPVVSMDNIPPPKLSSVNAMDVPDDNGGQIQISWSKSNDPQFEAYNIYIEGEVFDNCRGLNPSYQVRDRDTTQIILDNEHGRPLQNGKIYYVAVTAMDYNGHDDKDNIDRVTVIPQDNLPPAKLSIMEAMDVPDDNGGAIEVQWTTSDDDQFSMYRVYVSDKSFSTVSGLTPVMEIGDRSKTRVTITEMNGEPLPTNVPLYVAATAVDMSGNEDPAVTVATVTALDNIPPTTVSGVKVEDVPEDEGGALKLEWTAVNDADFSRYEVYASENEIDDIHDDGVYLIATIDNNTQISLTVTEINGQPIQVNTTYYFAVVSYDIHGNTGLNITPGLPTVPYMASGISTDDLAPPPVNITYLADTPNDTGGSITLKWEKSTAKDFKEYRIFISSNVITSVYGLTPELVITDIDTVEATLTTVKGKPLGVSQNYYVAISVRDIHGNEFTEVNYYGPVKPINNIPPEITPVEGKTTLKPNENGTYRITVTYNGPNTLRYIWYLDGKEIVAPDNRMIIYTPTVADMGENHTIKVVVQENIDGGLSDSYEWSVYVEKVELTSGEATNKDNQGQATILYAGIGIALLILIVVLFLFLRKRKAEKAVEELEEVIKGEVVDEKELEEKKEEKAKELPEPKKAAPLPQPKHAQAPVLPTGRSEAQAATMPKLAPSTTEKKASTTPVLPQPEEEKVHGVLPPGSTTEEGVEPSIYQPPEDEGDINIEKAAEEENYLDLLGAMDKDIPTPKGEVAPQPEVKKEEPSGPRTGILKEGEEIKRDRDGWIVECVMRNKLPSVYQCPPEQMEDCRLTCIQKMRKNQ